MIVDALIGDRGLKRIRNNAMDFARRMYDPSILNPQADVFRRQASQGINDDIIREDFLAQLNRQSPNLSAFGGNQAAAIAGSQVSDTARMGAISDFERNLSVQELEAMERGRVGLANVQTQQLQTQAQQEAAISEAEMMYEAERSSRRQALLGQAINLGAIGMTGAFKPGFDAIKGSGLGLFNTLKGNTSTSWFDFGKAYNTIGQFDPNSVNRIRQIGLNFNKPITANKGMTVPGPDIDEDVVPAMLTPGEEVINAESAEESRDLLKLINENPDLAAQIEQMIMEGEFQSFNEGGTVKPSKEVVKGRVEDQLRRMLTEPGYQDRIGEELVSGKAGSMMSERMTQSAGRIGLSQMDFGDFYQDPIPSPSPASTTPRPVTELSASVMDLPEVPELSQLTEEDLDAYTRQTGRSLVPQPSVATEKDMNFITPEEEYRQLYAEFQRSKVPNVNIGTTDMGDPMDFFRAYGQAAANFWSTPVRWLDTAAKRRTQSEKAEFEAFMKSRGY